MSVVRTPEVRPIEGRVFSLEYRPPFHFEALRAHYEAYRVGRLEEVDAHGMRRLIEFEGRTGWIEIRNDEARLRLVVTIDFPDPEIFPTVLARVRSMFDLDVDPVVVATSLGINARFKDMAARHAGLRLPSGWDPFEIAVSTILGQLVSVARARALTADLVELLGRDSGHRTKSGEPIKLFPRPADIAASDLTGLGTTGARKNTLREFSRLVARDEISLEAAQDGPEFARRMLAIKGIGPWTVSYLALKILRHADAFPATDLILARALEEHDAREVARISPWRAYAAILLWHEHVTEKSLAKGAKA